MTLTDKPELRLIELFPQNEDWSLQTMRLLAQVAVGGADLFECARTAARIGDTDDPETWLREWSRTAQETADFGRAQAAAGHPVTAARALFRAGSYRRHSEFFLPTSDPRRAEAYTAGTDCFREAARLSGQHIERIEVPYENGQTLDGYFIAPDSSGEPRATVLFLGGADSWAEELVFLGGTEFVARGMNLVVVDTPGRGSSLRFKNIPSRPDYEVPAGAVLDHITRRSDVDPDRIGCAGVSLGGYYAPRVAAYDKRVKAVAAWCGTLDVLTDFYEFYEPLQKQLQWLLGAEDDQDARSKLAAFNLREAAPKIDQPVFVMHGTDDVIMDIDGARRFVAALTSSDVTFEVYESAGSLHCSYDYLAYAAAKMTDWFADRLGA
jgi:dipeptidyl aminopeptidase/acylaminoacyl peptidase